LGDKQRAIRPQHSPQHSQPKRDIKAMLVTTLIRLQKAPNPSTQKYETYEVSVKCRRRRQRGEATATANN
jgi:hypothetical protein